MLPGVWPGRADGLDLRVAERQHLAALQLDVDRGLVGRVVGHVEGAEERLLRAAGAEHVANRPRRRGPSPRPLYGGASAPPEWSPWTWVMRTAGIARQSRRSLAISAFEGRGVGLQAGVDQDRPGGGLDDVGDRRPEAANHVDAGHDRLGGRAQLRDRPGLPQAVVRQDGRGAATRATTQRSGREAPGTNPRHDPRPFLGSTAGRVAEASSSTLALGADRPHRQGEASRGGRIGTDVDRALVRSLGRSRRRTRNIVRRRGRSRSAGCPRPQGRGGFLDRNPGLRP